jgi:hypothetical protein
MRHKPFLYRGAVRALIRDYLDRARAGGAVREDPLARASWRSFTAAKSRTSKEVADLLTIGEKTVERHRANILPSLGCALAWHSPAARSAAGWSGRSCGRQHRDRAVTPGANPSARL